MQQRRGTASQWSGANPILNAGEIGWESDTNKFKIGDGTNHWADLTYFTDAASATAAIADLIDGAPAALDTLNELAAAINDDPNFFTTLATNLSNHQSDTTNIHGITDTSKLVTTDGTQTLTNKTITSPSGLVKADVGLGNVDNTSDANKPISDATQTALDLKAPKANPTFTGTMNAATVNAADLTLSGNLTVNGTTTTVNSTAVNVNNQVIFEGTTADAFETTLTVIDPTADRTIGLPDESGTLATQNYVAQAISGAATDLPAAAGVGITWDANVDQYILDTEFAGELAIDSVAGALNTGTGLQHNYDDVANTLTIDIDSTVATKEYADDSVGDHNSLTASVHGIADTAALVATTDIGTVTSTMIANGTIVDGDINASAAIAQSKIDGLTAALAAKALDSDLTAHENATTSVHGISNTADLATKTYANGKASDAIDAAAVASENYTDAAVAALTKSSVGLGNVDNTSDANKPVSTATQSALDLKADLAGPTFTGTVVLPSTTSIGNVSATELGYVDGVTSAIQTQLNAKAPLAGPTFTGTTTAADVTITGNLTVSGTTTTVNTTNFTTSDPVIYLGDGNNANLVDIGFVGSYNDGTYAHQGLVKDSSAGKWKLFKGVTDEPTTTVNFAQGSLDDLAVSALSAQYANIGDVDNIEIQYLNGVTSSIQTQLDAKAPSSSPTLATPTITGAITLSSSGAVFTDGTQTKEGVPSRTPIVQKTASYTLSSLTERDSLIEVSSSSGTTITIPTNSAVAYPVGTSIDILQTSTGQVTIAGDNGVTVNATPGLKLRTTWSSATLFKRATNTWVVYGDLTA